MKYCILIIDGASGWPLAQHGGKTCLELAHTPNLDDMAREGILGLVRTVPQGMEPSSACACMSVLGYDPGVYYRGRSGIEARSMGIPVDPGEAVFRCNLVAISDGKMQSYSSGHIRTEEARALVDAIEKEMGNDEVRFYTGVSYRHLCKIKGREDTLQAICTPPHDIPDKPVSGFFPHGPGSDLLRDIMERSKVILQEHPVNVARRSRGDIPATMVWLFWGSGQIPHIPSLKEVRGLKGALTSGVDLLRGLAQMADMEILDIPGVTDGPDNDYAVQVTGALEALDSRDLAVMHVEAPDEAGHVGSVEQKVEAIEQVDREMASRLRSWRRSNLRIMVLPDHPTPIELQTHVEDPVPFLLWGPGFPATGSKGFNETEAKNSGVFVEEGHSLLGRLVRGW